MGLFAKRRTPESDDRAVRRALRHSVGFCLRALRRNGFAPRTILDVGAYEGHWARLVMPIFPEAQVHLIEAQEGKRRFLEELATEFPGRTSHEIVLLGAEERAEVPFHVMETGSSIFDEMTSFPRETCTLPMRTCDAVLAEIGWNGVDLLKLDVQGAELEVLRGARGTLESVQALFLEAAVLPYNRGAPSFAEVIRFTDERGFALVDIASQMRLPSDALSQCDLIFLRKDSPLREAWIADQERLGADRT